MNEILETMRQRAEAILELYPDSPAPKDVLRLIEALEESRKHMAVNTNSTRFKQYELTIAGILNPTLISPEAFEQFEKNIKSPPEANEALKSAIAKRKGGQP